MLSGHFSRVGFKLRPISAAFQLVVLQVCTVVLFCYYLVELVAEIIYMGRLFLFLLYHVLFK